MIREIMRDEYFLQQKSLPASPLDKPVAIDLLETLKAHRDECVGMAANMIGMAKCIIVVNLGLMDMVMFNPKITKQKGPYENVRRVSVPFRRAENHAVPGNPSGIPGHGFQEADSGVHRLSGPDHPARGGPSGGDFDLKNGGVKK
ncbi:Polypeptide deformylase [Acidaminococcus fermentans]|uniref:Polypeptide deformylase n=1 Tax=Acidaminococcus fermentans TaxID=905 RepID=A0A1H2U3E0_ACIFE|nr:Polypeptide deformylase [Acidaminococcus fermentans]